MDIIFQNGEFIGGDNSFLADLAVAVIGAFIGTGGAVWIYFTQTKDQKLKQELEKSLFRQDKLKYLYSLLSSIIFKVDATVKSLDDFCITANNDLARLPRLQISSLYDFNRIVNTLNQEDHYHAYLANINDKKIFQIFSTVDYFYDTLMKTEKDYNSTSQYDFERRKVFAESVKSLVNDLVVSQQSLKMQYGITDPNYIILNQAILDYYSSINPDPSDYLNIRDKFLDPLLQKIVNIKNSPEVAHITDKASQANKALFPIILSNREYINEIKSTSLSLNESNLRLKTSLNGLKSFVEAVSLI